MTGRPVPEPDALSAAYWEAAARHELALARCTACGLLEHPPSTVCGACGSTSPRWTAEPVRGDGRVRSWTVVRQSFLPGFIDDMPFLLVDVELDAQPGLRTIGRLLDGPDAPIQLGVAVRLAFEDVAPGVALPAFALATS